MLEAAQALAKALWSAVSSAALRTQTFSVERPRPAALPSLHCLENVYIATVTLPPTVLNVPDKILRHQKCHRLIIVQIVIFYWCV